MKLITNECSCSGKPEFSGHSIILNFSGKTRRTIYENEDTIVVPLVMLREAVVNGAYVAANELIAESWNGVPVTIQHPFENGEFVSANDPVVLAKALIGRIFNASVTDAKLKAEAWINVAKAESIFAGIIDWLESGQPMDVSTGYFSRFEKTSGVYNGKNYKLAHHDIKPDHLALLPNETGACSWADGCGVRTNGNIAMNVQEALRVLNSATANDGWRGHNNRRGDNNDTRQIIADLISNDATPFCPDDMYGLQSMGTTALLALRDEFLPGKDNTAMTTNAAKVLVAADLEKLGVPKETAEKMVAAQTAVKPETVATVAVADGMPKTAAEFNAMVANGVVAAMKTAFPVMLAETRRPELLAKVIANTSYTKEQAEAMDTATLEVVANGIKVTAVPAANYGARGMPVVNGTKDNAAIKAMVPLSFTAQLKATHETGKAN